MKKYFLLSTLPFWALLIFGFTYFNAPRQTYTINLESSAIKWKGYKQNKPEHQHIGTVKLSSGTVILSNGQLVGGAIEVDMTSMEEISDNKNMAAKLIGHLKSVDFFNVNEYAKTTFTITEVHGEKVKGDLTVLGETKSIEAPLVVKEEGGKVTVTGQFNVNLGEFGVPYLNKKDENPISPMVHFSVHIEAKK